MYCFMIFLKNVYLYNVYIIEISFQIENLFSILTAGNPTKYPSQTMNFLCSKTQDAYFSECLFSMTSYVFTYSCKKGFWEVI